ncbi:LysR family transcriptional regulator [Mycobacterium sp. 050272]|uniref:LysR family transcriptional regulator n=1 Tax=Mycobacterium sp. 050272 TaxID=3142488 RepID=UPI00319668E7
MRTTHIDQVDLNLLPPLVALLEEQHVSRAADRVRLSQPAMSRALQRLRRHFGDELLVRGPDGYSLTPRAERLRDQLTTAITHLEQLFAAEAFDPATAAQSFRLAVSDYTVATFGPALVRTVLAESPNSTVSCDVLDERAFDKLDAGTIDLAIYGRAAPERYCSQHVFSDRFVCVVAAEHPLAGQASVSLPTYLRWPHLTIDIGQPWIDRALEPLGVTRRVAVSVPYFALAPSILPGTELVLTLPERVARKNADPAHTRILAAPRELIELEFYAVWHPRFDQDPSHSWLREKVRTASESTA